MRLTAVQRKITISTTGALIALFSTLIAGVAPSQAEIKYVPITYRQISGTRPFVHALLNGRPFLMMVHANLDLEVMTTHAQAARLGLSGLKAVAHVGIDKGGHVSDLGLAHARIDTLTVGDSTLHDQPLTVFEVPFNDLDGMLGTLWLRRVGAIVDFDHAQLGIPHTHEDASQADALLAKQGFAPHRFSWDPKRSVYVINALVSGKPAKLVVSTVTNDTFDLASVRANGLEVGPKVADEDGPRGAVVDDFLLKHPVAITIDGEKAWPIQPHVHDLVAYSSLPRGRDVAKTITGWLGADFMLANGAIIDYGTMMLFLRPPQRF